MSISSFKRLHIFKKIYLSGCISSYLNNILNTDTQILICEFLLGADPYKIYSHFIPKKLTDNILKNRFICIKSYDINEYSYFINRHDTRIKIIWDYCKYLYLKYGYDNYLYIKEFIYLLRLNNLKPNSTPEGIVKLLLKRCEYYRGRFLYDLYSKDNNIEIDGFNGLYLELFREINYTYFKYDYEIKNVFVINSDY
jgi:hypothetical protein